MTLVERNLPVQTLPPHRPDHPFTERVGLRRPWRRLEYQRSPGCDRAVDRGRIDRIAVVHEKPTQRLTREAARNGWTVHAARFGASLLIERQLRNNSMARRLYEKLAKRSPFIRYQIDQ